MVLKAQVTIETRLMIWMSLPQKGTNKKKKGSLICARHKNEQRQKKTYLMNLLTFVNGGMDNG